ncbi:hypothetical protein GOODEAATRI_030216, partial [Goodea atripinnis]
TSGFFKSPEAEDPGVSHIGLAVDPMLRTWVWIKRRAHKARAHIVTHIHRRYGEAKKMKSKVNC